MAFTPFSLPTPAKAWRFLHIPIGGTGNPLLDYQDFWIKFKAAFVCPSPGGSTYNYNNQWTDYTGGIASNPLTCVVVGSSDGVGNFDQTDRWLGRSNIIFSGSNNANHSWITLTFPGINAATMTPAGGAGTYARAQLCIDCVSSTTTGATLCRGTEGTPATGAYTYQGGFYFSPYQGFAWTGASAKLRPPCSSVAAATIDEAQLWYDWAGYGSFPYTLGNLSTTNSWSGWLHVMRSTDGMCNRAVFYSGGIPLFWFFLDQPQQPLFNTVAQSPNYAWNDSNIPFIGGAWGSQAITYNAMLQATWILNGGAGYGCPLVTRIGSNLYAAGGAASHALMNLTNLSICTEVMCYASVYTSYTAGTVPFTVASELDGTYPILPLAMACNVTGYRGRLGTIYDMWNIPSLLLEGDSMTGTGAQKFVVMGDMLFPWDGSLLTVL